MNFKRSISQTSAYKKKRYKKYIKALIELLRFNSKEVFHEVYDMIKVDFYSFKEFKTQRQLKFRRVFEIINILRSVYIVLDFIILNKHNSILYINNYVD